MKTITLVKTRKGCQICEKEDRYHVMLNGKFHGELYFNMTGYTGCYLPLPPTAERNGKIGNLDIGERGISTYKKEIAQLNKEWAEFNRTKVMYETETTKQYVHDHAIVGCSTGPL